jgi:hypothetical protein
MMGSTELLRVGLQHGLTGCTEHTEPNTVCGGDAAEQMMWVKSGYQEVVVCDADEGTLAPLC